MNADIGLKWFTVVLLAPVLIIVALVAFSVLALLLNAMLGRSSKSARGRGIGAVFLGGAGLLVLFVLLLGAFSTTTVETTRVHSSGFHSVKMEVHETMAEVAQELSTARQQALGAVQDTERQNPFGPLSEVPAESPAAPASPSSPEPPALSDTRLQHSANGVPGPIDSGNTTTGLNPAETAEERQKRLSELASHIGPWLRSLLKEQEVSQNAHVAARAAESSDQKIVVFQMPGPMRRTYALIPLTPAVEAAMSPMAPLLANGSLEAIADSLALFFSPATAKAAVAGTAAAEPATPRSSATTPEVAQAPDSLLDPGTEADSLKAAATAEISAAAGPVPRWVAKPQSDEFVVRTTALYPGEEPASALNKAINEALSRHLSVFEDSLDPALRKQARLVQLELDPEAAQACVVDTFERLETVGMKQEGARDFKFVYALVKFPESVDKAALQTIRQSLQHDRVTGLAVVIAFAWLALCIFGVVIRLWGRGTKRGKAIAIPVLLLLVLPLLLFAIGTAAATGGFTDQKMPRYPWAEKNKPVRIQIS